MTTLSLLSNVELLEETQRLAANERTVTAALVRCLIEVEDRALHLAQGCASMFVYTLRQLQDLLRHSIPDGDPSRIVDRALKQLLEDVLRQKCAMTERSRHSAQASSDSRGIPAAVRRAVWKRDGGQCAFVGPHGRCSERAFLEYHHRQPFAAGGKATVDNIELRCRAHNAYEAQLFFTCDVVRERGPEWQVGSDAAGARFVSRQMARQKPTRSGNEFEAARSEQRYRVRRTSAGSSRAAREAGSHPASSAVASRTALTTA